MDAARAGAGAAADDAGRRLSSPVWVPALIFLLAVSVRLSLLFVWVANHANFYRLHGETGKVALSLLHYGIFGNPYMIPTGPTAHPTPLWPALLWLIYGTFGITATAGYVRAMVAILSYSALFALLPLCAGRLGLGRRAGIAAGIVAALIPHQGYDEFVGQGVTAYASLAMILLAVAFLHRWTSPGASSTASFLLGLGCGAAFHIAPPLVLVVAGYLVFELCRKRDALGWRPAVWVVLGAALACVPWTWRNYTSLHGLFFIRSNFGLELRIANHPGADADIDVTFQRQGTLRHPSENLAEARLVRDLGEAEYMRRARNEALEWIASHPAAFLRLTALRFAHFWCGPLTREPWLAVIFSTLTALALLGLRRAWPALAAPAHAALIVPLVAYPLVYYVVSYVAHYPAPLAWLLLLLASSEVLHWFGAGNSVAGTT